MTMQYKVGDIVANHDEDGYLTDISVWNKDLALLIAKRENIELTPEHWKVIDLLREYHDDYQISPAIRVLVLEMKKKFGAEKGDQKYMYQLFPCAPAKQACKIGGLPKRARPAQRLAKLGT